MRTFIAFNLPPSVKEKLKNTQDLFKKCDLKAKWVEPHNLHLTLKFLGSIKEEKITSIKEILKKIEKHLSPLEVCFSEFGFFPSSSNPRVFFVSLDKEKELTFIAQELEKKLIPLGIPQEKKFKSHITLARIKEKKNIHLLKEKIKEVELKDRFTLSEIALFESILTPQGPIYKEIFKIILKN